MIGVDRRHLRREQAATMKIAIVGAGAVGGYLAAELARAGHEVSVVARGENLKAIRAGGLVLEKPEARFQVELRASEDPADLGPQDLVIVTAKTPDLPELPASSYAARTSPSQLLYPEPDGLLPAPPSEPPGLNAKLDNIRFAGYSWLPQNDLFSWIKVLRFLIFSLNYEIKARITALSKKTADIGSVFQQNREKYIIYLLDPPCLLTCVQLRQNEVLYALAHCQPPRGEWRRRLQQSY
jgi:hypothetical protein